MKLQWTLAYASATNAELASKEPYQRKAHIDQELHHWGESEDCGVSKLFCLLVMPMVSGKFQKLHRLNGTRCKGEGDID